MASRAGSTPGFLHTLPTILKSEFTFVLSSLWSRPSLTIYRTLIAGIRNLGACPCPRCLIPLDRAQNLGMARDKSQRFSLARVDDTKRRVLISTARNLIYKQNYAINSAAVERLLKPQSLVPTLVWFGCLFQTVNLLNDFLPECFFTKARQVWFQSFCYAAC